MRSYKQLIVNCADSYELDRALVLAIVKVESDFNAEAESNKGACGLMQLTPTTFEFMRIYTKSDVEDDIFSPKSNAMMGCAYLKYLYGRFADRQSVIAAYNAGEGTVSGWLEGGEYSADGKTLDYIPYKETRLFVKRVLYYIKLYGGLRV